MMARHKSLFIGNERLDHRAICDPEITANVGPRCPEKIFNGVDVIVRLINVEQVLAATDDGTTPVVKTALTLASGKKFKKYTGKLSSQNAKFETIEKPYGDQYSHQLELVVFDAGGLVITQLENLVDSKVCALIQYKYKGTDGDCKYELFGLRNGMKTKVTRDQADSDTGGAFKLTLASDPKFLEPNMPSPLYDTNEATTDTKVAGYTL